MAFVYLATYSVLVPSLKETSRSASSRLLDVDSALESLARRWCCQTIALQVLLYTITDQVNKSSYLEARKFTKIISMYSYTDSHGSYPLFI